MEFFLSVGRKPVYNVQWRASWCDRAQAAYILAPLLISELRRRCTCVQRVHVCICMYKCVQTRDHHHRRRRRSRRRRHSRSRRLLRCSLQVARIFHGFYFSLVALVESERVSLVSLVSLVVGDTQNLLRYKPRRCNDKIRPNFLTFPSFRNEGR